ncbi:FAD/NAD(P)-binding domain-containing protein [Neoconidiobolus thromboides FSU 785]|nr:FAD/NAD(P)-binding domain-containing protein [Neoconidiobolus thromboides FSU 785]
MDLTHSSCILLGTGLEESNIVSFSSLAKKGKSVVHIDQAGSYGGLWKVNNLWEFCLELLEEKEKEISEAGELKRVVHSGEIKFPNVELETDKEAIIKYIKKEIDTLEEEKFGEIMEVFKKDRDFLLEKNFKFLLSKGEMVELIQNSKAFNYLEFQLLNEELIFLDDKFIKVPFNKEQVFSNDDLSLIDKRKLVRFLKFAFSFQEQEQVWEEYKNRPLELFLREKFQLNENLINALFYSILYELNDIYQINVIEGLVEIQKFIKSMGVYGNHSLIYPLYGSGSELSQAFCRISAIHSGIYILNEPILGITKNDNIINDNESQQFSFTVKTEQFKINTETIIINSEHLLDNLIEESLEIEGYHYKSINIIKLEISNSIQHLTIPIKDLPPIHCFILNSNAKVCPQGYSIIYVSTYYTKLQSEDETFLKLQQGLNKILKYYFNVNELPIIQLNFIQNQRRTKNTNNDYLLIEDPKKGYIINGINESCLLNIKKIDSTINQLFDYIPELNIEE